MSKKSDLAQRLFEKIQLPWPKPEPVEGFNLVEQGMFAILRRSQEPEAARKVVLALRTAYSDWNELRVSQAQEIAAHLPLPQAKSLRAARDLKEYLQEVFQRGHGLELEFLRTDDVAAQRFVSILPFIGLGTAHYLMWLASDRKEIPITGGLVRVLDRIGLAARTGSLKKSRGVIEGLVPEGRELDFMLKFGEVGSRWCDAKKPACYACPMVDDCRYGKKAYREWQQQQKRMEIQRQRDEVRRAILAKKEDDKRRKEEERRRREEERLRHKREADEARKRREAAKLALIEAKRKAALEKQRRREDEARKKLELAAKHKAQVEAKRAAAKLAAEKAAAEKAKQATKLAAKKALELAKKKAKEQALKAKAHKQAAAKKPRPKSKSNPRVKA